MFYPCSTEKYICIVLHCDNKKIIIFYTPFEYYHFFQLITLLLAKYNFDQETAHYHQVHPGRRQMGRRFSVCSGGPSAQPRFRILPRRRICLCILLHLRSMFLIQIAGFQPRNICSAIHSFSLEIAAPLEYLRGKNNPYSDYPTPTNMTLNTGI